LGNSQAALANRLGISSAGVGYAAQRGEAIAHEDGYQLIQWDIDLFKGVPQPKAWTLKRLTSELLPSALNLCGGLGEVVVNG